MCARSHVTFPLLALWGPLRQGPMCRGTVASQSISTLLISFMKMAGKGLSNLARVGSLDGKQLRMRMEVV